MRNKLEKSNKTKFDYTARKLGVIGVSIMALTFIFGGITLNALKSDNRVLTNTLKQDSTFQYNVRLEHQEVTKDVKVKVACGAEEIEFFLDYEE